MNWNKSPALCKSQFRLVVSLLPLKGNNNHGLFWQRQQNRGGNAVNAWFSIAVPKALFSRLIQFSKNSSNRWKVRLPLSLYQSQRKFLQRNNSLKFECTYNCLLLGSFCSFQLEQNDFKPKNILSLSSSF